MTDAEIIKVLECCINCDCKNCPCKVDESHCDEIPTEEVLDLINRLKADNERLKTGMKNLVDKKRLYTENMQATREFQIEQAKSEARKEFAERLKDNTSEIVIGGAYKYKVITVQGIDNLLKEMG